MPTVYVALGSNLGDRRAYLALGHAELARLPDTDAVVLSPVYETAAVVPPGEPPQPPYLNAVARLTTTLAPADLHDHLRRIESRAGRRPPRQRPHWAPRTLDLDLLLYDDLVLHTPDLTIPHPRLHERRFVLQPLCDVGPDARHPVLHRTVRDLLHDLPPAPGERHT